MESGGGDAQACQRKRVSVCVASEAVLDVVFLRGNDSGSQFARDVPSVTFRGSLVALL